MAAAQSSPLPDAPPPNQSQPPAQPLTLPSPAVPVKAPPASAITVLEDTRIPVMTNGPITTRHAKTGESLLFTVDEDVYSGGELAIPRGATVRGIVVQSKKAGRLTGSAELTFELVSLDLGGRSYPLYTHSFHAKSTSKTKPTEKKVLDGAAVGASFGILTDAMANKDGLQNVGEAEAKVVAITTGIGAGVGTAVSALTPGPGILIPSESEMDFYLASPITIKPVSAKEAARLAQGLHPGGPVLYVRGDTP